MNSTSVVIGIVRRICALMALCLLTVQSVEAAAPVTQQWFYVEASQPRYSTNQAACDAAIPWALGRAPAGTYFNRAVGNTAFPWGCTFYNNTTYVQTIPSFVETKALCSDGTNPDTSKPLAQQCFDPVACGAAGTDAGLQNITIGWTNAPQISPPPLTIDLTAPLPFTGRTLCSNRCSVTITGLINAYKSPAPAASGLYRLSMDVSTQYTGTTCTASAASPDPSAPPPPAPACPGSAGSVNGQPVCLDTTVKPPPLTGTPPPVAGNPIPGKPTVAGTGAGTPSYSTDPATGTGTGLPPGSTTPSGSVTVPNGSGASANGASVTVNVPDSPAKECGGPGRAACKIDESGTSDGSTAFNQAKTSLDQAVNDHVGRLGEVVSDANKDAGWGWMPQLPQGNCTPFTMGTLGAVDWCPIVPTLKLITSWMLGMLTALSILSMVHKTIRGT